MAKKRLNTKFLALLAGGFVLGGGALGGLYLYAQVSPAEHVERARVAEAEGNLKGALDEYGKAAFEVRNDPDLYVAFADLAGKLTFDDPEGKTFQQMQNALAVALQTDPNHLPALRRQLALQEGFAKVAGDATPFARSGVPVVQEIGSTAARLLKVDPTNAAAETAAPAATVRETLLPGVDLPEARVRSAVDALRARLDAGSADADVPYYLFRGLVDLADRARAASGSTSADPAALAGALAVFDRPLSERPDDPRLLYRAGQAETVLATLTAGQDQKDHQARALDHLLAAGVAAGEGGAFPGATTPEPKGGPADAAAGKAADGKAADGKTDLGAVYGGGGLTYDDVRLAYGRVLESKGDRDAAEAVYRKLIEQRPYDLDPRLALADLLANGGDEGLAEAVKLLDGDLPEPPPGSMPAVELADQRTGRVGRVPSALAELRLKSLLDARTPDDRTARADLLEKDLQSLRALSSRGDTFQTLRLQGEIERARGEHVKAVGTLARALALTGDPATTPQLEPVRAEIRFALAQSHLALGQTGEAKRLLAEVARQPSRRALPARLLLIQTLISDRETDAARAQADELAKLLPDNPVAMGLQVAAYADDKAKVAELLSAYPEATPDERRRKLAVAYAARQPEVATPLADGLLRDDPTDESAAQIKASLLAQGGDTGAAVAVLNDLIAAKPDAAGAKAFLARLRAGDTAVDPLERLEATASAATDPYAKLIAQSQVAVAKGDQDAARDLLRKASALEAKDKPRDPRATEVLFNSALAQGKFDDAAEYEKTLESTNADRLGGKTYLVQLLAAQGKGDDALRVGRALVRDNADVAAAHLALGRALGASGDLARAADSYEQAVRQQPKNADALRGLIDAYLKTGRPDDAKRTIEQARRLAPDDPSFRGLATAWEVQYGDPVAAVEPAKLAAEQAPDNPQAAVALGGVYLRAYQSTRESDPARAAGYVKAGRDLLTDAIARFPDNLQLVAVYSDLARADDDAAAGEKAIADYLARGHADDDAAALVQAQFYQFAARPDAAVASLKDYLRRHPESTQVRRAAAELLLNQGKADDALALLPADSPEPAIRVQRVQALATLGRNDDALAAAQEALKVGRTPPVLQAAAFASMLTGDFDKAEAYVDEIFKTEGADPAALFRRAQIRLARRPADLDGAIGDLVAVRNAQPDNAEVPLLLAEAQLRKGNPEQATIELEAGVAANPRNKQLRLRLADAYTRLTPPRYTQAERTLSEARSDASLGMSKDPDVPATLALVYASEKDYDKAIDAARAAADLAPGDARYEGAVVGLMNQGGRFADLLKRTDPAVRAADPAKPETAVPAWMREARAVALAGLKRPDDAAKEFAEAVRQATAARDAAGVERTVRSAARTVGPDAAVALLADRVAEQPQARLLVADIYRAGGKPEKARQTLVDVSDDASVADDIRATARAALGDLYLTDSPPRIAEAIDAYEKVLSRRPDEVSVLNNLAYAYTLPGGPDDPAKALVYSTRAYDQMVESGRREPLLMDTHGWVLVLNGKLDEGMTVLREAIDRRPVPDLYYHLGEALLRKDQRDDAARAFQSGLALQEGMVKAGTPVEPAAEGRLKDGLRRATAAPGSTPGAAG